MKTFREIDNTRANLKQQLSNLEKEKDYKYSLYEKFLSPEYMAWLFEVASSMSLEYNEDNEKKDNEEKAQILLSVINDYISHNDLKRTYNFADDGESPKYSLLDYQIALNYQGIIGYLVSKHVMYNPFHQVYDAYNITIARDRKYDSNCDTIDMDKLVEFALNIVSTREEIPKKEDEIIENLKSEGLNPQEIIDLLKVAYAKVANEEISKKR